MTIPKEFAHDHNVFSLELHRCAGEEAMAARDVLKAECSDLKSSNTRMGEKIAELATRNADLDQQNATMRQVTLMCSISHTLSHCLQSSRVMVFEGRASLSRDI